MNENLEFLTVYSLIILISFVVKIIGAWSGSLACDSAPLVYLNSPLVMPFILFAKYGRELEFSSFLDGRLEFANLFGNNTFFCPFARDAIAISDR